MKLIVDIEPSIAQVWLVTNNTNNIQHLFIVDKSFTTKELIDNVLIHDPRLSKNFTVQNITCGSLEVAKIYSLLSTDCRKVNQDYEVII